MPYISIETIVGVVLLAALVGYGYTTTTSSSTSSAGASKSKKKNKKKAKASTSSGTEALVEPPKREGEKQADKANAQSKGDTKPAPGGPAKPAPVKQAASVAKPESKVKPTATQEKPKAWAEVAALPNQTTSVPESKKLPVVEPRPEPEPRAPSPVESDSSSSSSESEYEPIPASSNSDDGWQDVQSKRKKPISISLGSGQSTSTSTPLPVSTKIQRKNAKKAEAKKAAKAIEEQDRQRRLAAHKRDLERWAELEPSIGISIDVDLREKINQLYSAPKKPGKSSKAPSSSATLDPNGKLIWD